MPPSRPRGILWVGLLLAVILVGCGEAGAGQAASPRSPTPSNTATATIPTLTPLPTQPDAPTSTRTPRPTATRIARLCEHAYFQAVSGVRWTYQVSGSPAGDFSFTQRVSAVRTDGFTLSSRIGSETHLHTWACSAEGLTALQFDGVAAAGIALAGGRVTLETSAVEGLTLPAELRIGDRWQQTYALSGVQSFAGLPAAAVTGSVTVHYEVIGQEAVSVPFGDFQALRVHAQTVYDVRMGNPPFTFRPDISGISEAYYAPSIGLIKVVTDFAFIGDESHVELDLAAYSFH